MNFEPFKIEKEKPLEEGIADFEIISNKDGISKAGNEKMVVKMKVKDSKGNTGVIYDDIPPTFDWKIKYLLKAVRKEDMAEQGEIMENSLVGLQGRLDIKKQVSDRYGTQFKVAAYLAPDNDELNDDLPF